ncbi:hypothetical protein FACS189472_15140 [Alphaproteobacteria bacterium]|nr:hypothetical protein FACS189472_15140 [Alphaproteobacteria bacterium]
MGVVRARVNVGVHIEMPQKGVGNGPVKILGENKKKKKMNKREEST